jgi:hypothetical protein
MVHESVRQTESCREADQGGSRFGFNIETHERKFLGVNEDPQTRESLDKVLRTEDCEVRLAAGAQEGIGEFDSERRGLKEHRWVVDGERMTGPRASETAPNPSGGLNSVLKVHG